MDGTYLEDEFIGLPFPQREEMEALRSAGIADATLLQFPTKAADTSSGRRAFVLAVADRWDEVSDLIAWPVEAPTEFWTVEHRAAVLNEGALYSLDSAVSVFRTPLEWLAAGGAGIVILDDESAWRLLADGPALIAQDIEHARHVQRVITPPAPRARILVADHRRVA